MVHVDDHDRFFPEGINAERSVADGYSAEGEQSRHPDVIMLDARPLAAEHGIAHNQGENAGGDSRNQAEPCRTFAGDAGHIGHQHDHEEGQDVFEDRHKRIHAF